MEKLFIKNRLNKNISLILAKSQKQKGLVFIMPGLGNLKEDIYMQTFVDSFVEKDFTAIVFDVTNGVGESDGDYSKASFTGYYNDLSDVIDWARSQDWYSEPFVLVGHSMGGGCILWYGAHYPDKLLGIAPIATVIGGHQTLAKFDRDALAVVKKDKDGKEIVKKLDWEPFKKDILQYDIVPEASKFTVPVLMAVGSEDPGTPLEDQKKLYEKIPGEKEIHVIKGAPHSVEEKKHLSQIKKIFHQWIDKILK